MKSNRRILAFLNVSFTKTIILSRIRRKGLREVSVMDYTARMKYGTEEVEIEVKGAGTVEVLNPDPMPEIENVAEAFRQCVEEGRSEEPPLRRESMPGTGSRS